MPAYGLNDEVSMICNVKVLQNEQTWYEKDVMVPVVVTVNTAVWPTCNNKKITPLIIIISYRIIGLKYILSILPCQKKETP